VFPCNGCSKANQPALIEHIPLEDINMDAFTAKSWLFGKAPKLIQLDGDKSKKIESAQHIIKFPGGAIEVSRTTDGCYWAHILVNQTQHIDDDDGFHAAFGQVIGSRVAHIESGRVQVIDGASDVIQVAVLIQPTRTLATQA
jgi:hypothetical protein